MLRNPMKFLLLMVLLVSLAGQSSHVLASGGPDEDNLILNPGFEQEMVQPWTASPANNPDVKLERDTLVYRSGEASLKFTPRYGAASNVRQQVVLKKGLEYTFTAWVKLNQDTGKTDFVQMKLDFSGSGSDPNYKPGGTSYPLIAKINKVGTDWVELAGTHIYTGDKQQVAAFLYFETTQLNYAVINIDDVSMAEEKYPAAIEINGPLSFSIPQDEPASHQLAATVKNQNGTTAGVEDEQAEWAINGGPYQGISLSGSGLLTIEPSAQSGYMDISAWPASQPQIKQTVRAVVYSALPAAYDVHIAERPAGKALKGEFMLVSSTVGEATYRWLEADGPEGPFTPITGEHSSLLAVTEGMEGKFVRFEVTPADAYGIRGNPALSEPLQVQYARNAYYVDPVNGSDTNKGTEDSPFQTIEQARDTVRLFNTDMTEDITIYLRGGEYNYAASDRYTSREIPIYSWAWGGSKGDSQPLASYTVRTGNWVLDQRDSGTNGFKVIYKAYPGETPVVSGGRAVEGWTLHDADKNIYKAFVGLNVDTRQLYVNGTRAVRARSDGAPANLTFDKNIGHTTTDAFIADWNNIKDIEFVYHSDWASHRLKVESMTRENDQAVIRLNPGRWDFAVNTGIPSILSASNLKWIENAYELLDSEGEWYLDRQYGFLYYKPRDTEDMANVKAIIPVVDELFAARGASPNDPVENLAIEGISFEYAGWLRPDAAKGHHANQNNTLREEGGRLPEGAVTFEAARNISFTGNSLSKLGSTGLLMKGGIQNSSIIGNRLYDISGSGMNIEDPTVASPSAIRVEPRLMLESITIANNYIHHIGLEYEAASGLSTSIGQNIRIAHNEISHIPYTAIHMGWHSDGVSKEIQVENNYIHDILITSIYDGGAIYSLGKNLGTANAPAYTVTGNYIRNQLSKSGALFPDNESTWWYAANNVVDLKDSPGWGIDGAPPKLIHIHAIASSNHLFEHNYATTGYYTNNGSNNVIRDTYVYPDAAWPAEAWTIIGNAGLEPEFAHIRNPEEDSLLFNGGFETRQTNVWENVNAAWKADSAKYVSGVKGAKVSPALPEGHIKQKMTLTPGVTYDISVWVRLDSGTAQTAELRIAPDETSGQSIVLEAQTVHANQWTQLTGQYTAIGQELQLGSVFVQLTAAAGVSPYWLDEFQMLAIPAVSANTLQSAIADAWKVHGLSAEGTSHGSYKAGSKAILRQAITDAEAAISAVPEERYRVLVLLYNCRQWFEAQIVTIDKTRLEASLAAAEQLHQESKEGFLQLDVFAPGSKTELWTAIEQARQVLLDTGAEQAAIDAAEGDLEAAVILFRNQQYKLGDQLIQELAEYAETLLREATEGESPGQYPAGSKAGLQAVIDHVYAQQAASPTLLMNAMFQSADDWSTGSGKSVVRQPDGSIEFFGKNMTYLSQTFLNEVFEFDLEVQYKSSGDWPGFTLRSQKPDSGLGKTSGKEETSYLVSFKKEVWELQKWRNGVREEMLIGTYSTMSPRWGILSNTHIEDGRRHHVRFGAETVENGVRLFMYVDGEEVFDHVDDQNPLTEGGYFSVYASAAPIRITAPGILTTEQHVAAYEALTLAISNFIAIEVPEPDAETEPEPELVPGLQGISGNGQTGNLIEIFVNGSAEAAGTLTVAEENGQMVSTIELDQQKLAAILAAAGRNAVISLVLDDDSGIVIGQLNGEIVRKMGLQNAVLELKTAKAAYNVPLRQVDLQQLAVRLGAGQDVQNIKVQIIFAEAGAGKLKAAEAAATAEGFTIISPAIDFAVKGTYQGKNVEIGEFGAYVERIIAIPDGVDPSQITTAIAVEEGGTVRHIPTRIGMTGGKYYAKLSSLGNGTFVVVSHPLKFSDVAQHWAGAAVNEMGSRMIVQGTEDGRFEPDREINRAEFAAIMVRGLGLPIGRAGDSDTFTDVSGQEWYSSSVETASSSQLIAGYEDGAFRPMEKITRQEAMSIIAKAMQMTGLKDKLSGRSEALAPYNDKAAIAAWAQEAVISCIESGVVSGRSPDQLVPLGNITRAEAAVMIQKLLEKSELI